ncbi:MAG: 2-hydroxyacid dehydrogenase [Chloroflexota bacterium]
MPTIKFFTDDPPEIVDLIVQHAPAGFEVSVHADSLPDAEKVIIVQDADFLMLTGRSVPDEALRSARKLKLIQLISAGYNHMNLPLCQALGIAVANNGGTNAIDVAEHTIALILSVYCKLRENDQLVRTNQWNPGHFSRSTYTINGRTVGIIGMGEIGQRVAHLLGSFGCQLLYHDLVPLSVGQEETLSVTRVPLPDLLQQADIVTLHTSLTDESRSLISHDELALMKPTALLVNTCRGPVVDEAALIDALTHKRILGVALDVLVEEPPAPDNPILQMENVLLSPHCAGNSYDTWSRRGKFMLENIERVWNGQSPLAVVNG